MKQITLSCLVLLLLIGCTKETITEQINTTPDLTQPVPSEAEGVELKQYKAPFELPAASPRSSCAWIEIPAGSNNALAGAVNNACEGGIIYLRAGEHTLTEDVLISKSVKIIGERGAIVKMASALSPISEVGALVAIPEIHVLDAPGTLIQDISFEPLDGDGGVAILLENSPYAAVMRSRFSQFQFSVTIHESDFTTVMLNKIVTTVAWQTGAAPTAHGVINMNGKSAYIADNEISNAVFGIFASDEFGTLERNNLSACVAGVILCNVPVSLQLPSGDIVGSKIPATQWKVRNNTSSGNLSYGYLVIDGANNNLLENNEAANNGAYDIELTSETERFGFPTPAVYENTVNVGSFPNIRIKNCGPDNIINGGILIDISTDTCN